MMLVYPATKEQIEMNDVVYATVNDRQIVAVFSTVRHNRDAHVNGRVISVVRRLRAPSSVMQVIAT
jgi:hypothetical protein